MRCIFSLCSGVSHVLRRIPDGAEILPSHRLIKMRKHLSVHVEQVLEHRIGTVPAHVGEDVEIQQGVSIAEIAQIYPIYLAIRHNDIAGIKVSVQAGGCRLQFVKIACQPCLDIVRNHLVLHNHFPGTQGNIVKIFRIAWNGVKRLGIFCRNAGQFLQPFGMVGNNPSERLLALNPLDSHAVTLPVRYKLIRFGRWNPHLKDSLGA